MTDWLGPDLPGGVAFALLQARILPSAACRGRRAFIVAYWALLLAALILGPLAAQLLLCLCSLQMVGLVQGLLHWRRVRHHFRRGA